MLFLPFVFAAASLATADLFDVNKKPPVPGLPFPESYFTKTVASIQNTYCTPEDNKPGIKINDQTLLYSFGNGGLKPRANIYHSESLGLILAYEGSNGSSIYSSLRNDEFIQVDPNEELGLPDGAKVDAGFQQAWEGTWKDVKNALREAKGSYSNSSLIVTGHSQGAAQASLGAVAVNKEFGNATVDKVILFGPPRVGNKVYADFVDETYGDKYAGVVNGKDWVPTVPPASFGYQQPSTLVWINPANSTEWSTYPGQENANGPLSHIPKFFYNDSLTLDYDDHQGIYMHSSMGTEQGPCPAKVGGF